MVTTPTRARATLTAFGEVELTFPFSEDLRDALKSEIPHRFRTWDNEDRVWRVMGAYRETAIALLLEYFPRAETPDTQPRRIVSTPARSERLPAKASVVPLPPVAPLAIAGDDDPERDALAISVRCPRCGTRHDQPVCVVTQSAATVAMRETITPEFVSVCPDCSTLAVIAFVPSPTLVLSTDATLRQ